MRRWFPASAGGLVVGIAVASLTAVSVAGQRQTADSTEKTAKRTAWTAPVSADGHPDLSGKWSHNSATPFERPAELAGRSLLTDAEVTALSQRAAELFNGDTDAAFGDEVFLQTLHSLQRPDRTFISADTTGNYNHFWLVDRTFDNRTSMIVDPPDGRQPTLTEAAVKRRMAAAEQRKQHQFDGPEDIPLGERCITGTVPMLMAGYNNYYQIIQDAKSIAINMEMRHDTRMIPLDGRPHLPKGLQLWLGDPRGRWEGGTLVVDSTNFRGADLPRGGQLSASTHLIERFTLVDSDTLKYEATVDDPATWTKPWTAVAFFRRTTDEIYEYACHEGNEAMAGTLSGARAQEEAAENRGSNSQSPK
jgi:hypothetical protein